MMQRREFLAGSAAAAVGLAAGKATLAQDAPARAAGPAERALIELRVYHFPSEAKRRAFEGFMDTAMVPALGRAGVKPVGVFRLDAKDNPGLKQQPDPNDLYVVIPHKTVRDFFQLAGRIASDFEFLQAAQGVLLAPKSDPTYTRYDASLLRAFESVPDVQAPAKGDARVAQLRIYESHSTERGIVKIRMMEEGGEIDIFKRVGLNPVFFGQTIAGTRLPSLTYMVAFDDEKALKSAWDAFLGDAKWKELAADETYKDTVSNITSLVLRPVEGSQI